MVQKLYASALRDAVSDDPLDYGTLYPSASNNALPDLSATPNRLLQSHIIEQARVSPSTLMVGPWQGAMDPRALEVRLLARPSAAVTICATAEPAWDGAPLAELAPANMTLDPRGWDEGGGAGGAGAAAAFQVRPRAVSQGSYFIHFDFK